MLNQTADRENMGENFQHRRYEPGLSSGQINSDGSGLTLEYLLSMIRRRMAVLLLCAVAVPVLAWVSLQNVTPRYTAKAMLMFEPQDYRANELQSILRDDPTNDAVLTSQTEILRGRRIAERLVDRLHLDQRPEFNWTLARPSTVAELWRETQEIFASAAAKVSTWLGESLAPRPVWQPDAAAVRRAVVNAVQDAIAVQVVRNSRVLEVGFISQDRNLASEAANLVTELYLSDQLEQKFEAVRRANGWLETRLTQLRQEVTDAEQRMARYRASEGLVQGVSAAVTTEQISRLNADLLNARNELALAEARVAQARGSNAGATITANQSTTVQQLRIQEAQLRGELQRLQANLGGNHPDVVRARRQLGEISAALGAEIGRSVTVADTDLRAARQRVAALEQAIQETQSQISRNAETEIPLKALEREAEVARNLFQAVLVRSQQVAQQTAIEKPDARIISPATPPALPSFPRSTLVMLVSILAGIVFGLMVVYLMEMIDSTFRNGDDIRLMLGLPCFVLVPQIKARFLGQIPVEEYAARKPLSPFAESMRALRAGLWLCKTPAKAVAITAARPGEGKTITAISLGRSAALNGEKVIVIDCDIRQPSFGRLMRADTAPGIVDFLTGHATADEIIRRDWVTGMDFIPAGAGEANSLGLLMSEALTRLLSELKGRYDLVLLDAPPALAMADARVVARMADATILCVRWRDTPRSVVRSSLGLLEDAQAHVVGAALTRVDAKAHARSGFADADMYHPRYGGYYRD